MEAAKLVLRGDNGEISQEYLLEKLETSIGRSPNSDIVLSKNKFTSRHHATIRYENGKYVLRDERSANGTFVNGQQLEELVPYILYDGDRITIGEYELLFYTTAYIDLRLLTSETTNPPQQDRAAGSPFSPILPSMAEEPLTTSQDMSASTISTTSGDQARLILHGDNLEMLQEYALGKSEITIGRGPNSDILLPKDKLASRLHATIRYENNQYVLYDQRSANGTFVNGQPLQENTPRILQNGDRLGIGEHELIFRGFDSSTPAPHLPGGVVDMPTLSIPFNSIPELTYRTHEDDFVTAPGSDEFGTKSMDAGWYATLAGQALPQQASPTALPRTSPEKAELAPAPPPQQAGPIGPPRTSGPNAVPAGRSPEIATPGPTTADVSPEQLRFTAFHPKEVAVETWNTLLVYTYIEPAEQAVHIDANRFRQELGNAQRKISTSAAQLQLRGAHITIVPECKGVSFNPKRITFTWLEDWHRSHFRFSAKKELAGSAANGKINIFAGPVLIGSLKMALLLEEQIEPPRDISAEVTAGLYKHIFASYSHDDTLVVLSCRNIYKALGFNILIDIETLRAGEVFSDALKRMIDTADIFQLFWSERAARSAYVNLEWEYALQLDKGEGFVRPVYWELPLVPPPDKLAPLHFAYLPAYTFNYPPVPR